MKKQLFIIIVILIAIFVPDMNTYASDNLYGEDIKSLEREIANELTAGNDEFEINFRDPNLEYLYTMFSYSGITRIDEGKSQIDIQYTFNNLDTIHWSTLNFNKDDKYYNLKLSIKRRESKAETDYTLKFVNNTIKENSYLKHFTDYERFRWVYNYIIDNLSYDYKLQNQTAYSAVKEKSTICSGFSGLFYLMTRRLGLESRIVYGKAAGIPHAWNLVKLNEKWYCVDTTWGDGYNNEDYLLKSLNSLNEHILDPAYLEYGYDFSETDYNPEDNSTYSKVALDTFNNVRRYKKKIVVGSKIDIHNSSKKYEYSSDNKNICTVNKKGIVKGLKKGYAIVYSFNKYTGDEIIYKVTVTDKKR